MVEMMQNLQAGGLYKLVAPHRAQQPIMMRGTPCYNVPVRARFTLLQRKLTDPLSFRVGIFTDRVQQINSQKFGVAVSSKTCQHANVEAADCQVSGPRRMENIEMPDSAVELNDTSVIPALSHWHNHSSSGAVLVEGSVDSASSDMGKNERLPKENICLTAEELQRVETVMRQVREELALKPEDASTRDLTPQLCDELDDDDGDVQRSTDEELKNNTYINKMLGALFEEFPYDDQKRKRTKKVVHWQLPESIEIQLESPPNSLTEEEMKRVEALMKKARQEALEASMREVPSPGKKRHRW